ncbi:hypothetical protein HYDPIDRAFT_34167 [Hydnomerulius pinastri MD-312]|uniref:Uncharacterized protein n=1 Tax=Hydnomerulius pinastri MD-312 TaxID=994086 RepID=A0A0C9UZK8_9AGAM|nr:hypothetical protein HYDPIDRAFT_34167 [Hydnomerulius pinastri MD-312]
MAEWSQVLASILEDHKSDFMDAKDDPDMHAKILKTCRDKILDTPQANNPSIILPDCLRMAICQFWLPDLDLEDRAMEQAQIDAAELHTTQHQISAEEREAVARPTQAGDYVKPWDAFRAAQRLFKDKFSAVNKTTRDVTDKKMLRQRTKTANEWWTSLSKEKKQEAEATAKKWNDTGADKEKKAV